MGSKKQRNKVNLEKVFELPQMSEEMGQPVFIRSFDDAIKAAEHFGCDVIWGANLENGLPVPFPTGEIWVIRDLKQTLKYINRSRSSLFLSVLDIVYQTTCFKSSFRNRFKIGQYLRFS